MSKQDHELLCWRYLTSIEDDVAQIGEEYGKTSLDGRPITIATMVHPAVRGLCEDLETIFMHNIISSWFVDNTCWAFLIQFTRKEAVLTISRQKYVKSDGDRVKVWIRIALNESWIVPYLEAMTSAPNLINKYYDTNAFMKTPQFVTRLKQILSPMNIYTFSLPLSPHLDLETPSTLRYSLPTKGVTASYQSSRPFSCGSPYEDTNLSSNLSADDVISISSDMSRRRNRQQQQRKRSHRSADITPQQRILRPISISFPTSMPPTTASPSLPLSISTSRTPATSLDSTRKMSPVAVVTKVNKIEDVVATITPPNNSPIKEDLTVTGSDQKDINIKKEILADHDLTMDAIEGNALLLRPKGGKSIIERTAAHIPGTCDNDTMSPSKVSPPSSHTTESTKLSSLIGPLSDIEITATSSPIGFYKAMRAVGEATIGLDRGPPSPDPIIDEPDFGVLLMNNLDQWESPQSTNQSSDVINTPSLPANIDTNQSPVIELTNEKIDTQSPVTMASPPQCSLSQPITSPSQLSLHTDQSPTAAPVPRVQDTNTASCYSPSIGRDLVYNRLLSIYKGYQSHLESPSLIASIGSVLSDKEQTSTPVYAPLNSNHKTPQDVSTLVTIPFEKTPWCPYSNKDLLAHLSTFITLCPLQGLVAQDFKCWECKQVIGLMSGEALLCGIKYIALALASKTNTSTCSLAKYGPGHTDYTGQYYCVDCHKGETHVIPARILCNWDMVPKGVCVSSAHLLRHIYNLPIIDLRAMGSSLLQYIPELRRIEAIRTKLGLVKDFLLGCRMETRRNLLVNVGDNCHHLDNNIHLYSLKDLTEVSNGVLEARLRVLTGNCLDHISQCNVCLMKGSYCDWCESDEIIYPFNQTEIMSCTKCSALAHRACYKSDQDCPRCKRLDNLRSPNVKE